MATATENFNDVNSSSRNKTYLWSSKIKKKKKKLIYWDLQLFELDAV